MRILLMVATAALALAPADPCRSAAGTPQPGSSGIATRVLWRVSGYVMGKHAALDEREAKTLLFEPLDITEDAVHFHGRACNGVRFRSETVVPSEYLPRVWQVTPQELGIKDEKIQLVRTNCVIPGFGEYLHLNDNRLIVPIDGVFFYFEPAVQR